MIFIFFGNGHDDVFSVEHAQQHGGIQPAQMVCRHDHISLGYLFHAVGFDAGDHTHHKADNGT
jgi:hypothetical protein